MTAFFAFSTKLIGKRMFGKFFGGKKFANLESNGLKKVTLTVVDISQAKSKRC